MENLDTYRRIIRRIITEQTKVPYSYGEIRFEPVFDAENDRFLLMIEGWNQYKRVHGCLLHLDLKDGKIWIHRDGTDYGIANDLLNAGIPKDRIVLAFKSPELRKYTEFAAA